MNIFVVVGLVVVVLFVGWRMFIRTQGVWIDAPSDPHEYVKPELAALVDWLATQAESQIGRGHVIAGDPIALGNIAEVTERALAGQRDAGSVEINIPELIGDAEGWHGFRVTLDREQLRQYGIGTTDA